MARESKRRTDQEFANQITHPTRLPYIPNEIIVDILPRLPAKSLLRFRCVCKSWLSLIADKKFRKKHLRHMSTIDDNYSLQRVIFESHRDFFSYKSCSLDSIYSDLHVSSPITLDHTITIKEQLYLASIVGSCDGLVCTSTVEGIYVWNPTLRESRRLPRFKVNIARQCDSFYGFGYDYSSDDYKVVAVSRPRHFSFNNQVNVYTLSNNSWRRIQAIPHGRARGRGRPTCCHGIFSNGALHWPLFRQSPVSWTIIALDLATETYHEIAYPTDADVFKNRTLGFLGGCLCVMMSDDCKGKKINVWIMKEYGQVNSWTKLACFPTLIDYDFNCHHPPRNPPLFVSKNGEMLVINESIIYLYNLKDNTSRSPVIPHSLDCTYLGTYVESLVSLRVEDSVDGQPET